MKLDLGRDFFLYGLSFLLLMEWILPLPHISNTGFIHIIILISAFFFIVSFTQLPVYLSILLKSVAILWGMNVLYFEDRFFSMGWVRSLFFDVRGNFELMMQGHWYVLTDMFRSILFLILLAIMAYLLFYWIVHVRRILFFLISTIVYVAVIDTFTVYDATYAMIRTFVIGFLLLGLLTIYRRIEFEKVVSAPKFLPIRLATLLVMMIVTGGVLGFLFPKFEPQWDDPVPFVRAAVGMNGSGFGDVHKKIGYGNNDEQLGGGFVSDETPVFYAAAAQEHYWRGETKDFYSGKGWKSTTPPTAQAGSRDSFFVEATEQLEAEIAFADGSIRYSHLFYPGELITNATIMKVGLSVDTYTAKASTFLEGRPVSLSNYRYEYAYPHYNKSDLRSSSEIVPREIQDYYTQLPEQLPERIGELTAELMAEEENRFDRAKAIEDYLSSSRFRYETENVPVPNEDEDYVDQFLFETRRGYCDNFSTTMVVMLRTQGIPARWVKGFSQGEKVELPDDDERTVYEVTNGNAHSWVEVYFAGAGWVPFEPTRGFDLSYEFLEGESNESEQTNDSEQNEDKDELQDVLADMKGNDDESANNASLSPVWKKGFLVLVSIVAIGVLLFLLFKNKKFIYYYTRFRFKKREDEEAFIPAYENLLWLLDYSGWKRKNDETLREYAVRIDQYFSADEMVLLTNEYERIMYGGKQVNRSWSEQKPNWESLLQKIKS
ncbi:peptidase [bacterium LRH843]|nr:peptidase [bacterium LRH843]